MFEKYQDYMVPLLRLLAEYSSRPLSVKEVLLLFDLKFGLHIPPEHREKRANGKVEFEQMVKHARTDLTNILGYVAVPISRHWQITQAGLKWLQDNPNVHRISAATGQTSGVSTKTPASTKVQQSAPIQVKSLPQVDEREICGRAWRQVVAIRAFLQSRAGGGPRSEQICDWIHFCYQLELFREVIALWSMVRPEETEPWQYKRTQRIVRACQSLLGS